MKEKNILKFMVLFSGLLGIKVLDKIIPDVHYLWVGKDFAFSLNFWILGLQNPIFPTLPSFCFIFRGIKLYIYLLALLQLVNEKQSWLKSGFSVVY